MLHAGAMRMTTFRRWLFLFPLVCLIRGGQRSHADDHNGDAAAGAGANKFRATAGLDNLFAFGVLHEPALNAFDVNASGLLKRLTLRTVEVTVVAVDVLQRLFFRQPEVSPRSHGLDRAPLSLRQHLIAGAQVDRSFDRRPRMTVAVARGVLPVAI